ncbi:hypothetical protein ZIOFF_031902 [Zingiber officinale]|uniref:Tubulin-specific chaperone cofactor E-like protein n=1 Tax=Zingiber officinale TaxID=94328 RepID=A0A8J5GUP5_ZINOF|nr:hypothetical protein ZIOFF_031902 [Zingiber officinale]
MREIHRAKAELLRWKGTLRRRCHLSQKNPKMRSSPFPEPSEMLSSSENRGARDGIASLVVRDESQPADRTLAGHVEDDCVIIGEYEERAVREECVLAENLCLVDTMYTERTQNSSSTTLMYWPYEGKDIDTLCKALPALEILNLTNNLMDCKIPYIPSLGGIRVLVLSNCGITWNQVEELKESLSAIQELHLMKNNIQIIVCASNARGQGFDSLRVLNLEENHIESWDEILKLSYLRSLEQLHLNRNKLRQIYYPLDQRMTGSDFSTKATNIRPFECLQCLLLGSNEIDNAASIDSLNLFPRLMDIRLSDNPIVDPSKGGVSRFVLVARLAKVKFLNGSEVSQRERKESEIRYVRLVMSKMQSDDLEEIQRFHPRFVELKALHGIADETPSSGISGPQKMSSGLICVTLKCVGASMGEKQPLTKKLPSTVTVGKLKALCESFFKLKGIRLKLFIQEQLWCHRPALVVQHVSFDTQYAQFGESDWPVDLSGQFGLPNHVVD